MALVLASATGDGRRVDSLIPRSRAALRRQVHALAAVAANCASGWAQAHGDDGVELLQAIESDLRMDVSDNG